MIKIKPIIFSAAAAFVFSFFTALFAKSGLPVSLLKAVIFALVFGALAVGVQFLYANFLSSGAAPQEAAEDSKPVGGKVDLVVSEEDLPEDKDGPSFFVDGKHFVYNDDIKTNAAAAPAPSKDPALSVERQNEALDAAEKVREEKAAQNIAKKADGVLAAGEGGSGSAEEGGSGSAEEAKPAFAPIDLAAKSSEPAGQESERAPAAPAPSASSSVVDELDDLPDIGNLGGGSASAQEEVIEDSEFAQEGTAQPKRQTEFADGKVADVKDAPIMAEAIRTILKNEE